MLHDHFGHNRMRSEPNRVEQPEDMEGYEHIPDTKKTIRCMKTRQITEGNRALS